MNKLILTPILVLVLAVAARAQLYDNGLLVNRSNLISNWQMPTVITAGGAYTGVSGVVEHRGPSVRTLVNDGIYVTTGSHTDKFMGPGGQSGAQEIAGTNRPLFRNLQLINGAGQLLNITNPAGISVSQSLTFANGITTTVRSYTQAGAIVLGDSASYTGGTTNAQHVNGYVSKIGSTIFTFPVGSGTDSRPLTISAPPAVTDHYSVAWIVGDPTTTTDPSGTPALHPVASREAGLMAVSTLGQWDWIAVSGTGAGLTITVPLPDLTAFSAATDLRLVGWNGNQWINLSTGARPYLNGTSYASGNADGSTLQGTMVAGITAIGIGGAPTISLSGTVFNDGNGLTDNLVNQIGNGPNPLDGTDIDPTTAGNQALYATLLNSNGTTLTSVAVTSTGTYAFSGVAAGTYSVQLSTQATIATSPALPQNWVYTGEQLGTGPGHDGTPNGILTGVVVGTASVGQANFGINKRPTGAIASIPSQPNPGAGSQVVVPATVFTGTDLEDGTYANNLTGRTVSLSAATGGTLYYAGQAVSTTVVITNFDPTKVTLDPTATQATSVQFTYTVRDNAGTASDPTTSPSVVTAPFTAPVLSISGTVFDDGNGLTDNTVNGSVLNGTAVAPIGGSPVPLYVSLWIEATLIGVVPVSSSGTYSFTNVRGNAAYYAILSTNPAGGDINNRPLSAGWVNTGENIGAGAGNDGLVDGILNTISLGSASVSNANFGIDRRPEGADVTLTVQANPGGTAQVPIPPTVFTGTDLEDGTYANNLTGRAVSLSAAIGGTLYYAGNPVSTSLAIASFDPTQVTLDPSVMGTAPVVFRYSVRDNANVASLPNTITVPFTSVLIISGTVFDDGNGLTDNTVNGSVLSGTAVPPIGGGSPVPLYVALWREGGTLIRSEPVTSSGTYSFSNVTANATYFVVLSTNSASFDITSRPLPAGWVNTGENVGTGAGSDGTTNGILTGIAVGTSSVSNANFGIDRRPEGTTVTLAAQPNPGGNVQVPVSATAFTGTDLEDGPYANNLTGRPVSLNAVAGGTLYYAGNPVSTSLAIASFNPAQLTVDPTATGTTSVSFAYSLTDNAGVASIPARVTVPFSGAQVSVSGQVFDDGNGLTDGLVNPVGTSTNPLNGTDIDPVTAGNQALYATLVSNSSTAVATVPITNMGTYSFTDVAAGTYSVVLSTNASGSTTASLPANWVNTGEQLGTTPGSDGTPNGILTGVVVGTTAVGQANFGINKKPEAANGAVAVQANPGGTNQATVFATAFTGSDLEDGPYANNLTGRPVSLSAATGGTLYYQGSAVATATDIASFDPTKVTVDPTATNETVVSFAFTVKDNAGVASTPKAIAVPFYDNDDDDDNDEDDTDDDDDGDNDDDGEQDDRVKLPENTIKLIIPGIIIPGPVLPIIGIFIPSFPFGILTLIINGTIYTKDTFPPEGIIVRTDEDGDLVDDIIVEPIDPKMPPAIPFVAIDPTGKPVTTPGTATATPASLTSSGPLSCTATTVTLTATDGGNTYRFSPGATSAGGSSTATVTTAGVYSVTVTGANGYEARASTRVTADQNAPTAGLTNSGPLSCTTTSVTLTATGGGLYRFSAGATQLNNGPTATVSNAGVYSVTVTGANGCTATASTTVTANGGTLLAFTNQPASASTVAAGTAVSVSVGVSGAGSVTYQWYKDNVGNAVANQTSAVLSLSSAQTSDAGSYFVVVTGTCNSLTSTAFALTVRPVPDLTPVLYARPTTLYGSATVSVVVDVVELNEVATDQDITLYIAKTASVPLSFDAGATEVGGRRVQNGLWRFDGVSNANFYVFRSSQRLLGGGQLSVGMTGTLRAGATSGVLPINTVLLGSGGEVRLTNNSDADKLEYFPR